MKYLREFIRYFVINLKKFYLVYFYKMNIDLSARISYGAKLDKTNPRGINIGSESYIASGAIIFSHDFSTSKKLNTFIGSKCFIGANAIIMPGVRINDEVVIGSGSVVTKNIPSNVIVAGNPSKIIKNKINTSKFGKIIKEVESNS